MEVLLLKFNLFRHLFQAYIYPPHYNERYPSLRLPIRLIWEKREPRAGWNPPSQESWSALNKKLNTGMWELAGFIQSSSQTLSDPCLGRSFGLASMRPLPMGIPRHTISTKKLYLFKSIKTSLKYIEILSNILIK